MIQKYRDYTLHAVYGQVDADLQAEIVAFWARNNAIGDLNEAWRRTREVAFVVRNAGGAIVGISSVYISTLADGKSYYFYRMFLQPRDRVFGMMRAVTMATSAYLAKLALAAKPAGMVIITENVKLMRKGMRRMFVNRGYVHLGKTPRGLDVWKIDFSVISPPPMAGG